MKKWASNSIVYYTGKTSEPWSPDSLKTGVGGSQTAVIYLSKIWQKMGFTVTVYSDLPEKESTYDGVRYINYREFNPNDKFSTLILWREPSFLDMGLSASRIFLDLHDVPVQEEYTNNRIDLVDKIFVKSKFQRSLLPEISEDKFAIISNGFDENIYKGKQAPRDRYKLIYASSYYRGLEQMLTYGWPIIKNSIPSAELHIHYGWNLFDLAYGKDKEKQDWKNKMLQLMNQDGVAVHGRVGQEKLIESLLSANILYYGCTFKEVDCITVRQAAYGGCIPFTTEYGALSEKDYCIKVPSTTSQEEIQKNLAKLITYALENDRLPDEAGGSSLEKIRKDFVSKTAKETWGNVAEKWLNYIY